MRKWIDVYGKKMDSVEFTRFIRTKTTPEISKIVKKRIKEEKTNDLKLDRINKAL